MTPILLARLFVRGSRAVRPHRHVPKAKFQPQLELLERRDVLTGVVSHTVAGVVNTAATNDTWFFKDPMGTTGSTNFAFGGTGWVPVTGDWWGTGESMWGAVDTSGTGASSLYDVWYIPKLDGTFMSFTYGAVGWTPVTGQWAQNSNVGIGVVDLSAAGGDKWYLRHELSSGSADLTFSYGANGWVPISGCWSSDSVLGSGSGPLSGIGAVDLGASGGDKWYLRNTASAGTTDYTPFNYGNNNWIPVSGDWAGIGHFGIGVVDKADSSGMDKWYERNAIGAGTPDSTFTYGGNGWTPVAVSVNATVYDSVAGYGVGTLAGGTVSATVAQGTWNVPSISGTGNAVSVIWVGLDGFTLPGSTSEEIGTEQDLVGGVAHYSAFFQFFGDTDGTHFGPNYNRTLIPSPGLTVNAGDSITASITLASSTSTTRTFTFSITDNTTSHNVTFNASTQYVRPDLTSAEWIVEKPEIDPTNPEHPLANFGTVTFSSCSATINSNSNVIGGFNYPNARSVTAGPVLYLIDMVEFATTILATTSQLNGAGSGFTVTYNAGGAGSSIIKRNVITGSAVNQVSTDSKIANPTGSALFQTLADDPNSLRQLGLVGAKPTPTELLFALADQKPKSSQSDFDPVATVPWQPIDNPLDA